MLGRASLRFLSGGLPLPCSLGTVNKILPNVFPPCTSALPTEFELMMNKPKRV
jgi:hypothetical protein